ncbi:hypothetical protein [Demequina activiva]|nr:hypothetical protein [Demequina activiva]
MHADHEQSPHESSPGPGQPDVPEIEEDQTVAPRPEEEIADIARSEPDPQGHGAHPA